jgi:hypothetical protein
LTSSLTFSMVSASLVLAILLSSITEIAIHVLGFPNSMFSQCRVHSSVQIVRDPAVREFCGLTRQDNHYPIPVRKTLKDF